MSGSNIRPIMPSDIAASLLHHPRAASEIASSLAINIDALSHLAHSSSHAIRQRIAGILALDFEHAAKLQPGAEFQELLSPLLKRTHCFLQDINRLHMDWEEFSLPGAFARALRTHLPTSELAQAHLSLTTELSGASTYEMSMAILERVPEGEHLPLTLPRHGRDKSPWRALFSDFAGEFSKEQACEVCALLAKLCPRPAPDGLFLDIAEVGNFSALFGAALGYPNFCSQPGFIHSIDQCALMAARYTDLDYAEQLAEAAWPLFDYAKAHGLQPLAPGGPVLCSPLAAHLTAWSDAMEIESASLDSKAPKAPAPRL